MEFSIIAPQGRRRDALRHMGKPGLTYLVLGGVMYSIGAVLYGVGKKKRYSHSVFHVFCLLGTFFHFLSVYVGLL